jgi:formate dehydrogenase alpha subunit
METITIVLNGKEISGRSGMTILELAREAGVEIPTLCHSPHVAPFGACRVCLVEDEARHALVASCVTPIAPGMTIRTDSPLVLETRRTVVELLLSSHPEACVLCDKGNACALRALAADLGIGDIDMDRIRRFSEIETANAFIERDLTKCIMCGLCVRACQEIQVIGAIDFAGRGFNARPATPFDMPLDKAACEYCGTCVTLCPVGALSEKTRQYRGTGLEQTPTVCSFCGSGCSIMLQTRDNRVMSVEPNEENSVNGASLCVRGHYGHDYIHNPERLTVPLIKENGSFKQASWDAALDLIAHRLTQIREQSGPDSIAVFGSFRCTNEENYLIQKFARAAVGTNNVSSSARMSTSPNIVGLTKAFGYPGATGTIADIEKSGVILCLGANPHESHPLIAQKIKRAARFHGAKLLLADPRQSRMTPFAHLWLRPAPGTDIALVNAMLRVIMDENLYDKDFVRERVDGLDKLLECARRYPPAYAAKVTGIPEEQILEAARIFAGADAACIIYGSGITHYPNATYSVLAIANLAMATGNIGRPGVGVYPLVKENNGQGACDMGVLPDYLPGYRKVSDPEARADLEKLWGVAPPAGDGLTGVEIISQAAAGGIRAIMNVGANPVAVFADSTTMKKALESLDFFVALDIFPTPTTNLAHVVLPVACFAEKDGTFTSAERRIQRVRKAVDPPGQSRAEWQVLSDLCRRMGLPAEYKSPADIMAEIARAAPIYAGVSYARLERQTLHWPCENADHAGSPVLYEHAFPHRDRAQFMKVEYLVPDEETDMNFPFSLITRSHLYHFGSGARTMHSKQLKEMFPECFLEIGAEDAEGLAVADGQRVKIVSRAGSMELPARITPGLPRSVVFVPVSMSAAEVNSLFSTQLDVVTRTPNRKMCAVQIERM